MRLISGGLLSAVAIMFINAPASWAAANVVTRPAVQLTLYRRTYSSREAIPVQLSAYNSRAVRFALYPLNLSKIIRTSSALDTLPAALASLDFRHARPCRSWVKPLGKIQPETWEDHEIKLSPMHPGIYLLQASVAGSRKRTWFAVSDDALIAKRYLRELLLYAVHSDSGSPVAGAHLWVLDSSGKRTEGATNENGILELPSAALKGSVWISGKAGENPLLLLSGEPAHPDPHVFYTYTDRPIYRPGQKVYFKGTVRARTESGTGEFGYLPYAGKPVLVEIHDSTDAVIYRKTLQTNIFGSYAGELELAPETGLGRWQILSAIGDEHSYVSFDVQAYRKPEMTIGVMFDKRHCTGGSTVLATIHAEYYFGKPVTNARVQYTISGDAPTGMGEGTGVTDSNGELKLTIPTTRMKSDRSLSVQATVTDLSRRTQTGTDSLLITTGDFSLNLTPDRETYLVQTPVTVNVQANDYDGNPVQTAVRVRFSEWKQDRNKRNFESWTDVPVTTGADGQASATFTPDVGGQLTIHARAADREHNEVDAEASVQVLDKQPVFDYAYPTLALALPAEALEPGASAEVSIVTDLLTTPQPAPAVDGKKQTFLPLPKALWALLTVEGDRMYRHQIVRLTGATTVIHLPVERSEFPGVRVSASLVLYGALYEQQESLLVHDPTHELQIQVTPDKAAYQPGEEAVYSVATRDNTGKPVAAEVSVGIVDSSIYALKPDETPSPASVFYPPQTARVQSDFSLTALYSGGGWQSVPANVGGIRVRRNFADTAFWNAFVTTDAAGLASIHFTVPDNPTTWRATARGITLDTAVGSATRDAVSTMPFVVRLALPRFYVQDDRAVVSAVVQNFSGTPRSVRVHLNCEGGALQGSPDQTIQLASNESKRIDYTASIGSGASPAAGKVRFLVTADGGPGAQDAVEMRLPVAPDGLKTVDVATHVLTADRATAVQDLTALPPGASVTLTLSPSIASGVLEGLDCLIDYPYGCAEQTMSAMTGDIAVARALRRLHSPVKVTPDPEAYVALGLQRLYRYQHADGGWHWWEFDQSDGDMTAYILNGLIDAKAAGFVVDDQRILRGTNALLRMLQSEPDLSTRADWTLPLARVRPESVIQPLQHLFQKRARLDSYDQASLCLALQAAAESPRKTGAKHGAQKMPPVDRLRSMAVVVARDLESAAVIRGTSVRWEANPDAGDWRSDPADVTAHVLRALLAVDPQSSLLPSAVRWLMSVRDENGWSSTRSTAEVLVALTGYLQRSGELHPDFTTRIALDSAQTQELKMSEKDVFRPETTITFTPEQLRGHREISVEKTGSGVLYLKTTVRAVLPPDHALPLSRGLSVRRLYSITVPDPTTSEALASGSTVDVDVEVTADADYRHVLIEDPIPAGCEVVSDASDEGSYPYQSTLSGDDYVRQEVRDDHVAFFFDSVHRGRTRVHYSLSTETPGFYHVLPSIASLIYFPEVRGNSGLVKMTVSEAQHE